MSENEQSREPQTLDKTKLTAKQLKVLSLAARSPDGLKTLLVNGYGDPTWHSEAQTVRSLQGKPFCTVSRFGIYLVLRVKDPAQWI